MPTQYTAVGARILSRLKAKGITQVQLSRITGLSTTAISAYCKGKRLPETPALHRIAKALESTMEWLLTGENQTIEDSEADTGIQLSQMETDVILMLRLLNEHDRKNAIDIISMLYEQTTGKKGSIYSTYLADAFKQTDGQSSSDEGQSGIA